MLCAVCYLLGQFEFQKQYYCNAVTPITDLICALFGHYAICSHVCELNLSWKVLENEFCESWKTLEFGLCKSWKVLENSFLLSVRTLFLAVIFSVLTFVSYALCYSAYVDVVCMLLQLLFIRIVFLSLYFWTLLLLPLNFVFVFLVDHIK